jgi:hypothetical protein
MNSEKPKKVKKKYRTNPRSKLYLLDRPICKLPANKLPTIGQVIQYLQYLKSPLSTKFHPTAFHAGCKLADGTSELKCKNTVCEGKQRCATSSVIDTWKEAGFDGHIYTGRTVMARIVKLQKKYSKLIAKKSWTPDSKELSKDEQSFIEESDKLFDISLPGFENRIQNDRLRDLSAREEDLEFYKDQLSERKMFIDLTKQDMHLEEAIKRQNFRQDRENRMIKAKNAEVKESIPSNDILMASSDESDIEASVDSSSDDSDVEKLDRSFSRQSKSKIKPKVK